MAIDTGRRSALSQILVFAFVATGFEALFSGCGSSSPASNATSSAPSPQPTPAGGETASACIMNGTSTTVEGDPLHQLAVPKEDVAAGVDKSYHIQGQENHDHIVTLSAQDFATLRQGNALRLQSGLSIGPVVSHTHFVDVSCAS